MSLRVHKHRLLPAALFVVFLCASTGVACLTGRVKPVKGMPDGTAAIRTACRRAAACTCFGYGLLQDRQSRSAF